jgi:DNA-binding NarL/FixJ family response regulator
MTDSLFHVVYVASDLARRSHRLTTDVVVLPGPEQTLLVYRASANGWIVTGSVDRVRWAGDLALVQARDVLYLLRADALPRPTVTEQDQAILRGLAAGGSHRDLADELRLTEGTIHQYITRLLRKFGAKHRAHLIAIAKDQGLM